MIAARLDRCSNFHDCPPQCMQNSINQRQELRSRQHHTAEFYPAWVPKDDAHLKDLKSEREETTNLTISRAM